MTSAVTTSDTRNVHLMESVAEIWKQLFFFSDILSQNWDEMLPLSLGLIWLTQVRCFPGLHV